MLSCLETNHLYSSQVDCFLKIFPGVSHGWTVKYPSDDEEAVKSAAEAHQDMLDWFAKFIC